jgi:hypothetical protein
MDVGCQVCGQLNPPAVSACQYCGAPLSSTRHSASTTGSKRWQVPHARVWRGQVYLQRKHGLKDPNVGLLLELLPGLIFFLGIGHLWAGQLALGIALLFGYWFAGFMLIFFALLTALVSVWAFPFCLIIWPGVPIISAIMLQRRLQRERQRLVGASTSPYPF